MTLFLELVAVAALVLLNALFVAAEYALVTVRRTRMNELADAGNRRARLVLRITQEPPRFIAAMQLGVTVTSLAIGALGEHALERIFDPVMATAIAVLLSLFVLTFFHVVAGELVPKGISLGYSEQTALLLAAPVRGFFVLFKPLIWFLQRSSEITLRALGLEPPGAEGAVYSEAELKMLLDRSTAEGELEQEEQEMLYKVFDFADKEAADIMRPRPEVVALSVDLPPEECLRAVIDSPYTRYPVYRETPEHIIGVLHLRDLLNALNERGIADGMADVQVEEILRPAYIVPETKDIAALLTEFRRTNQHMAVVVDEYGDMEGIVTLEDVIEEIVGEIEDEFDLPDESVEHVDDRRIRIDGTFPIDDFNEQFEMNLPVEDYHTMGGYVFGLLGRAPEKGDVLEDGGVRFSVLEVEGNRIERLEVEFIPMLDTDRSSEAEEPRAAQG
ncbi:MAG TPA: hemolysin family protein [Gaiellaceae bacterium]|nr:hemolysin family protein [Gaiellaceae bacterium]